MLIPFFFLASDPRAPVRDYDEWLTKMSGKHGPGAYTPMYR